MVSKVYPLESFFPSRSLDCLEIASLVRLYHWVEVQIKHPPVTTQPDIKSTAEKLWNYTFSAGIKNIVIEKKNLLAIICDWTCIIFDGETKISKGKQQKQGGRML